MPRYALAQINCTVGDLDGNAARILSAMRDAAVHEPDLVIFPELTLAGYPPEDLLLKPGFFGRCAEVMDELVPQIEGAALIGYPAVGENGNRYNAAALVRDGLVECVYHKCLLPNYAVFDEKRYFSPGTEAQVVDVAGQCAGVIICEDAWEDDTPANDEAAAGAQSILCLSASPFHRGKHAVREETFRRLCVRNKVWFLYCNLVGGQDDLVFDGGSLVMNPEGVVVARAKEFAEDLLFFDVPPALRRIVGTDGGKGHCGLCCGNEGGCAGKLESNNTHAECGSCADDAGDLPRPDGKTLPPLPERHDEKLSPRAEVYEALCLGVGDYVRKNGFPGVIVGLSGGIDSALTAAIAVDALRAGQVIGVTMPSRYSSGETISDAEVLAKNLGIRFETLAIQKPHEAFHDELAPLFAGVDTDPQDLTDQNIQARVRAVYLMALSNKFGHIVLNTSNKSESAVGYGTLYGDMVGGYAAIKDVFKTQVWDLSRYVNEKHGREVIPVSTIDRVPTAELRENQEDRQSIPDYPELDPVLELYVEQDMTAPEIIAAGHNEALVKRVIALVDKNEFKRRQSVMGARVTPKAFGKDRRLPVTNRFR